jgi:hypothetical protein
MMNILEILQADYQRFPVNQTYEIYASDVYFRDPLTEFRGVERYKQMIGWMSKWFQEIKMDLHKIDRRSDISDIIDTRWTLHWRSPLPWRPSIAISGTSELKLNSEGLIISHIDYWDCSVWDVIGQHFRSKI